jgi:KamA family protein
MEMDKDSLSSKLFKYIAPYLTEKDKMAEKRADRTISLECREKILELLNAGLEDWHSWEWQMANRFTQPEAIAKLLNLTNDELLEVQTAAVSHRIAISPFLLALLASAGTPVAKQFMPSILEIQNQHLGELDPMAEEQTSPVPHVTQRYPDRIILNVTNICGSFCRFCQRRRNHGNEDVHIPLADLEPAFAYLKQHREIRDVLITGGDPFTFTDKHLSALLKKIRQIPSVEIMRIGTRIPVVIPQRVTIGLTKIIRQFAPVYVNIHINHPLEVSPEMEAACRKLILSGAVMGSQTVLLNGVNNSAYVLRYFFQLLLQLGIKPYYLFHAKDIVGTEHFRTPVSQGLEIIESLRGVTSGLAIPNYVVNMPGGLGKVVLKREANINNLDEDPILFKTWENKIVPYPNNLLKENDND